MLSGKAMHKNFHLDYYTSITLAVETPVRSPFYDLYILYKHLSAVFIELQKFQAIEYKAIYSSSAQ